MRLAFIPGVISVLLLATCSGVAQSGAASEDLHGLHIQQPKWTPTPTPFPLDVRTGRPPELEFKAASAMSETDRTVVDGARQEIVRRAGLQGFRLDGGQDGWGYEQAVCPVFPDHVVIEYSRLAGPGDVTLFSVVIPRGAADGHVRVIPVRRRGYTLFTPSSSNELTINDFNHMVKESPGDSEQPAAGAYAPLKTVDWLTLGLCYSALAGGHVRAELAAKVPEDETYPMYIPAKLQVSRLGGAAVYFVDTMDRGQIGVDKRREWKMVFAQSGQLMKVQRIGPNVAVFRGTKVGGAVEAQGFVPAKQQVIDIGAGAN